MLKTLGTGFRTSVIAGALACAPVGAALAQAPAEKPQYGGTLNIGMVYLTLSPLSWDPVDWPWKFQQDTGLMYEQLFVADLNKSKRKGGKHAFVADSWLPTDGIRGELAESWQWKDNPPRVEIKLRKGVMFPDKPGIMAARELVADDVVGSYTRLAGSKKAIPTYFEHVKSVEAPDKHTVVFTFNNFHAEWDYRFGWGYYSGIVPKEVADAGAGNWKNANGTGPFMLTDYVQGNAVTFTKNPKYWDKEKIGGTDYKLPFADKIVYRTIKDEATFITALRTAKLDVLEAIRWSNVDELKKNAPALKWSRFLDTGGTFLSMRTDTKPFDDVRVRRALNMAVNKQEIVSAFYGGNAELFAYPMHPDYIGYYEPLDKMTESARELFVYNPDKAKALLAEAGYPKGFSFKVQVCSCSPDHMDLLPLVAAYLEKVGVKLEIQPMEYGAFLSAMTTKTNAAGYFMRNGHTNPTTSIHKSFVTKQTWNPLQYSDPEMDKRMAAAYLEKDESRRQIMLKVMTRDIVEKAPYIWLPVAYAYTAWWPWVKNYGGELRAGSERPGPIHARMWVDQEMKRKWASENHMDLKVDQQQTLIAGGDDKPLLSVRNLVTRFRTDRGMIAAVDRVSFDVGVGETLAIVGESGSGKSVTALSILRLIPSPPGKIESGEVIFDGVDLLKMTDEQVRDIRGNRIAMIFQEPMSSLNPALTVGMQVAEPINQHRRTPWAAAIEQARALLGKVRMSDTASRVNAYPHQFSGGMRQRAMIAMALACEPQLIIADEPTTALDVTVQAQILDLLKDLAKSARSALILITHDLGVVARYADRVVVMYGGRVVESAPARELYKYPRHPYTRGLMASVPRIDGDTNVRLVPVEGQPPDLSALPPGCAFAPRCRHATATCLTERPQLRDVGVRHQVACLLEESL